MQEGIVKDLEDAMVNGIKVKLLEKFILIVLGNYYMQNTLMEIILDGKEI